ncbi:tetratricopeptide repeat protein [Nonomuraea turkmeniaca]|uniref:Tetratricopeptide repeat protein n=1 Tax=Nonomuraea turkmeniaca TaxID=103838 RepID=A0A5S4GH91_9ACTN|nr:BTAD domain-containing putative transcriptional regulator [Nonomuraea turkmeniaca]TMR25610.1 tetratricopeptide repeat protein [Nonomuraea turkmeniaca]
MDFRVLGPLRVTRAEQPVVLPSAYKLRLLLACLLSKADQQIATDALIDALWGERPPASARRNLQQYVHRLRSILGADALSGGAGGYEVAVGDRLDATRFRRLVTDRCGAERHRVDQLRAALDLWQGPAFAEFSDCYLVAEEAERLDQLRLATYERWIQAELARGRSADLVIELTDLVRAHPYRESLRGALMVALRRSGRPAEALQVFRATRALLNEQLGTEPGQYLQQLHQAILRGDEELPSVGPDHNFSRATYADSAPLTLVPHELPRDVSGFTGRDKALAALHEMLSVEGATFRPVVIVGTAGVGKTALAVHWAHQIADQFPDGQLHLNLRGYAAEAPMRPIQALDALLRALGMPPERIPADVAGATARYRTLTAGRRLLILLDNVATAEQVRPLLPGSAPSLVLITSRDRLTGLVARDDARRLTLGPLTAAETETLLGRLLGTSRVTAEPASVAELAEVCSYLPLPLRIGAAHLADRPHHTIAEYVAELRADNPITMLRVQGDTEAAVRTALDRSYLTLTDQARQVFRGLGLIPLPDFSIAAVAALAGIAEPQASHALDQLEAAHLIDQHQPGRYMSHDLLGQYARALADTENTTQESDAAVSRLLDWYLSMVRGAAELLHPDVLRLPLPERHGTGPSPLQDPEACLRWLDAERHNLVAAIRHAGQHGPRPFAWLLADGMRGYLDQCRSMNDWLTVGRVALAASRREKELLAQGSAFVILGHAYWCLSRYHRSVAYVTRAAKIYSNTGWLVGEASVLGNLGTVLGDLGRFQEAEIHLSRALELSEQLGRPQSQASAHNFLAILTMNLGNLTEALKHSQHAMALYQRAGALGGEATARATAGEVHHSLGRFDAAQEHLSLALRCHRDLHSQYGEADTLASLAQLHRDTGQLDSGRDCARSALEMARDIGDRHVEFRALIALAGVSTASGDHVTAIDLGQAALRLADEIDAFYLACQARIELAAAHQAEGLYTTAVHQAEAAITIAQKARFKILEGLALNLLAEVHAVQAQSGIAADLAGRALDCHRMTGHRLGQARAHVVLARALHDLNEMTADTHRQAAIRLYTQIGAPVPEELLS